MKHIPTILYVFALCVFVLLSNTIHAQNVTSRDGLIIESADPSSFSGPNGVKELEEKVYFNITPSKPRIGDEVEIEAEMYGSEIKNAIFTWTLNGKNILAGTGRYKVTFILEEKSVVNLTLETKEGNVVKKTWTFNPQNTVLIWESGTYTPPFYKGKPLYSPESSLVLHALNLQDKNPLTNTYVDYTWKVDGSVQGDLSGVGKNTFMYQGDLLLQEPLFQVSTSKIQTARGSIGETIDGSSYLRVQTFNTDIFAYENSPLFGILYTKQIGPTYSLKQSEGSVVAYPTYFGLSSSRAGKYEWYINDTLVKLNSNIINFKKTRSGEQSRLSISIKNPNSLLQGKDKSYLIDTTQ